VLELVRGIVWTGLETNLVCKIRGRRVLWVSAEHDQPGEIGSPQSGAQAGSSWSRSSNFVNSESMQIAHAALSARIRPIGIVPAANSTQC
jgi:hypothetical protein